MTERSRREFLWTAGGYAAAALALPRWLLPAAPRSPQRQTFLPLAPGRAPQKVVIAGAGLAGLVAGYELDRAGHDVAILEAQLRPGGRVLTLRAPFSDGLYAEAGAARIPDTHDLTLRYAREFNLKLAPFYPATGNFVNQISGQRLVGAAGAAGGLPAGLTIEEQKLGAAGLWQKYVAGVVGEIGDPAAAGWSAAKFAAYDAETFPALLRRRGASPAAVRLMTLGADFDGASALRILADLAVNGNVSRFFKIDGGNDLLPRAFAEKLAAKIHYGAELRRVQQNQRGVRAAFLQGNLLHTVTADRLICTIPFPVLKRVEFDPQLSDDKFYAMNGTYYLSASRLFFQEDQRFWAAKGLGGFALADWPIEVWYPTFDQKGPRGILVGCLTGELSRRVSGLPEDRRIQMVLNEIETLFSGAREHFEGGVSKCWDEDYWAKGAAQWFRPGQMVEFGPHMAAPEGRVHFAGEHTSPWPAWMQGALHSGLRAAAEVHNSAS
ncbi:MAG TPA: FAD-dependent oxidoreductase [Candidatus Acidoferrales bacterium]|nr:FAD-dependent oxidoreductase [Candidatus Acidoferrales bacterium]